MFGAVHLEVMLIMRCVLHGLQRERQESSQQLLKINNPCFFVTNVASQQRMQARVPIVG